MFERLKSFLLRGNLIDLAVGFTVGAAFGTVARSVVDDLVMPPISLLLGPVQLSNMYVLLKPGVDTPPPYTTLADAQAAGAVTLNYGLFINNVLTFLVIGVSVFLIVQFVQGLEKQLAEKGAPEESPEEQAPTDKKCPYCKTTIPYEAIRCPNCTTHLDEAQPA
jgi:large conductance mechanosensitive channel